jgi:hypothetical protein
MWKEDNGKRYVVKEWFRGGEAYYRGSCKTKEGKWRTINSLPRRMTPEEAEKDLEAYAERKGLVKLHLEGRA